MKKIIAKVIDHKMFGEYVISIIDTTVPAILYNPEYKTGLYIAEPGYVSRIPGDYPLHATIEIEPMLLHEGDIFNGITIKHDCYTYKVTVI